jgi:hypothetical protein
MLIHWPSQPRRAAKPMSDRRGSSFVPAERMSPALEALDRFVASHGETVYATQLVEREAAAALDRAVLLLCAEAREVDPDRAERLVLAVKRVWSELPATRALRDGMCRARLLETVVSACITRFYTLSEDSSDEPAARIQELRRTATGQRRSGGAG